MTSRCRSTSPTCASTSARSTCATACCAAASAGVTPSGKEVLIEDDRLVSFEEKHLAILRLEVTVLNADAPVTIGCQLINRQDGEDVYGGTPTAPKKSGFDPRKAERIHERVLQPEEYWQDGARSALSLPGDRLRHDGRRRRRPHHRDRERVQRAPADRARHRQERLPRPGEGRRADPRSRSSSAITPRAACPRDELVDRCRRTLDRAEVEGVEFQYEQQRAWLAGSGSGRTSASRGTTTSSRRRAGASSSSPRPPRARTARASRRRASSGSGYSGHYFWDTEIYVLPFLAYTTPLWARNALRMRYLMLPAARRRARQLNEAGALFPWRTINGEEASAYYAAGTAQYHINADVSFALAKYVRASGDAAFLYREGIDIAVETARLWNTLGFWRSSDGTGQETFHIHGVTGPGRVHDGRERQPLHERHGPLQPALRRAHRPRDGARRSRRPTG